MVNSAFEALSVPSVNAETVQVQLKHFRRASWAKTALFPKDESFGRWLIEDRLVPLLDLAHLSDYSGEMDQILSLSMGGEDEMQPSAELEIPADLEIVEDAEAEVKESQEETEKTLFEVYRDGWAGMQQHFSAVIEKMATICPAEGVPGVAPAVEPTGPIAGVA
eukprot:GABV01009445.1.p1 GENE.GABV01009445.1~~GABV01009445.1.p1  ORF type:complete len:164 (+),score=50.31 GABV01009445.1:113-604(+)